MSRRRTGFLLVALLLTLGVSALGWLWFTRFARPEAKLPRENTYLGLPTSRWREQLNEPTVSHYWPPLEFPLRQRPHRDAIPVLRDLLADRDPRIREAAACCLGFQPSPEDPVLPLLIGAVNDPHPRVRLAAMEALAQHGQAAGAAAPVLLAVMGEDDADIRFEAAWAFYHITGRADPVLPTLIRNLRVNSERCQNNSAYMLGKIGPPAAAAVDALVQRLEDQSAPPESEGPFGIRFNHSDTQRREVIHRAVLEALGDIGPNAKAALPIIRSFLRTPSGFVRASACVTYWKITGEVGPAVEPLVELLETEGGSGKRWSANGLERMGPVAEAAIPALIRALDDADAGVRRDAALALGSMGHKARKAVPRLIELIKTDKSFRNDIAEALKAIDAKGASDAGVLTP